jgi:hypothetical protein
MESPAAQRVVDRTLALATERQLGASDLVCYGWPGQPGRICSHVSDPWRSPRRWPPAITHFCTCPASRRDYEAPPRPLPCTPSCAATTTSRSRRSSTTTWGSYCIPRSCRLPRSSLLPPSCAVFADAPVRVGVAIPTAARNSARSLAGPWAPCTGASPDGHVAAVQASQAFVF